MANGANGVRDRISAFLAGRGWEPRPLTFVPEAPSWPSWPEKRGAPLVVVISAPGAVVVTCAGYEPLDLPADSPDLMERLGETLDGLGV